MAGLDLSALEAAVAENDTVDGSAITLLDQLMAEVEANKGNPAAIQAIVDRVRSANATLAAAVARNTPASPETPTDTGGEDTGGEETSETPETPASTSRRR